jgi:hypothetical protein
MIAIKLRPSSGHRWRGSLLEKKLVAQRQIISVTVQSTRERTTKNGNRKRNGSRMAPVSDPAALKSFGGPDGVRTRNPRIISLAQQGFKQCGALPIKATGPIILL